MTARPLIAGLAALVLLVLLALAPAAAPAAESDKDVKAPKAEKKPNSSKSPKAAKDAKPRPAAVADPVKPAAPDDPDLAGAGKVIEFDSSGNGKVVKGDDVTFREPHPDEVAPEAKPAPDKPAAVPAVEEKPPAGEMSAAEACRERFRAKCAFLHRCMGQGGLPFSCEELLSACDSAQGASPYSKKEVDACAKGVSALKCAQLDLTNIAGLDPEAKVPACREMVEAERVPTEPDLPSGTIPGADGQGPDIKDIDIGAALGGH